MAEADFQARSDFPFKVTDPSRLPAGRYFDEEFYRREVEHLWPHSWQMACRLEQIPDVGDWIEYNNVGQSVIVVRTGSGVRAFHNACRHRGVPLTGNREFPSGNCATTGFVCPFHGWRWNMDGENTYIYGKQLFEDRQLDADDIRLKPCRVEEWGGCAWINHDNSAPPFKETLGPLADRLEAHGIDHLRAEWCYATVLPANWKIAMGAFLEGYHVATTHPQLQAAAPMMFDGKYVHPKADVRRMADPALSLRDNLQAHLRSMELLSEGMSGMAHAKEVEIARSLVDVDALGIKLPEDPDLAIQYWYGIVQKEVSRHLQAAGEPVPDLPEASISDPIAALELLFPHYFLLPYFTSMAAYRVRPLGPESCYFEIWSLTMFPKGEEPDPVMEPIVLPFDSREFPPIPQQDFANIPIQQKGIHSKSFEFMRLSRDVEGLVSNFERLVDGYLASASWDDITKATHTLAGNFEGPIKDFTL